MKKNVIRLHPAEDVSSAPSGEAMQSLLLLARLVRVDPATGDLVLQNGKAKIVLHADGTVRVQGARVVCSADETLTLDAAIIDLN
jgi:hypothetical protein